MIPEARDYRRAASILAGRLSRLVERSETKPPGKVCLLPPEIEGWNPLEPTYYLNGFKLKTERATDELRNPNNRIAVVDLIHTPIEASAQIGISGHFEKVFDGLEYPDISPGEDEDGVLRIVTDAVETYHHEFVFDSGSGLQDPVRSKKDKIKTTETAPEKAKDSAGRECTSGQVRDIEIRNRYPKVAGNPIPHTWIKTPKGEFGWSPISRSFEVPGAVGDNSNRKKYPNDLSLSYDVCPETLELIYKAIDDNRTGYYVFNNRPKAYTETIKRTKHIVGGGSFMVTETIHYPKGYNCVGWAMMILESAGIRPPVPSPTPGIYPGTPK